MRFAPIVAGLVEYLNRETLNAHNEQQRPIKRHSEGGGVMPYIKKDDLKFLLHNFFTAGCNAGHGMDHENDLAIQEDEAFEEYYKRVIEREGSQWK
jgi:hypothetical protein